MPAEMERPHDPRDLYHACGDDIVAARPVLTGDVYEDVTIIEADASTREMTAMILDHPCSLRVDGVNLVPRLTVAEVTPVPGAQWNGSFNRMFLPPPFPQASGGVKACAAFFDRCYHISPEQLQAGTRIACLNPFGINLLLQRRVKHFSRVTVETFKFQEANEGVYEEADLIEEWCLEREDDGAKTLEAMAECMDWIREKLPDGRLRQQLLEDSQSRSTIRRDARAHLKALRQQSQ
ncbi:hypothetical protein ABZ357_09670 [Streptomyces sp. NPDC005917]|uniref:hypothetical protein n=1 Tax=unclassified Streptomyces TaxID=2593676 RepID=UPI0033CFFACE